MFKYTFARGVVTVSIPVFTGWVVVDDPTVADVGDYWLAQIFLRTNGLCFSVLNLKKYNMKNIVALMILSVILFASCDNTPEPGDVTISLKQTVGDKDFVLDQMIYQTNAGHPFSISRLRYYLSDFTLHNSNSEENNYHKEMYHLYDKENPDSYQFTLEAVPAGTYDKITFTFGLDDEKNVDDGLDNTVANQNMIWPIPGDHGYHYMKYEGRYDSLGTGVIKNFNTHLGATQNNQNYFNVTIDLPSKIKVDNNTWNIDLNMDLLEWYQNPNDYDFVEYGQMIMMNQSAQLVLKANGASVFSVVGVSGK